MSRVLKTFFALVLFTLALCGAAEAQDRFEGPILLTSAGQSADITIAGMLFKKLNVPVSALPMATAADLRDCKTVVVVAGFSMKGLGSAGINREQELDRVKSVLKAARDKQMRLVVLHIGGKARRGPQSDEFNRTAALAADHLIVVKAGDDDQFFTKLAADRKVPLDLVDKIADAGQPLGRLFR